VTGRVESANFLGDAILYRLELGYGRNMLPKTANEHNRPPGRGG
jgi:TOBE domain-containing protein